MTEEKRTKPKVSILVPCYNVAKYLPECLDSIVNQTLGSIEIICINDGSTDETLDIIKRYAEKDSRIVIIDKENEGYGKSMNRGIDAATGEYIGIVESDDWVEPDAFETLFNTAKKHKADVVKADFVFFDNDTRAERPSWGIGLDKYYFDMVFCPAVIAPQIIWSGHPSIWTCLYKTKMIRGRRIYFPTTPGASFQDMGFKPKTFIAAERFVYIDKPVLHYRKHANNSDKNNSKIFAVCDSHDDTDAWARENVPNWKKYEKILNQARFANYVWNLRRLSGAARAEFRQRFRRDFRDKVRNGEIEYKYMDTRAALKLKSIVHPHNFLLPLLRELTTIISPIWRVRICDGNKVYFLFNKIPVYKKLLGSELQEVADAETTEETVKTTDKTDAPAENINSGSVL